MKGSIEASLACKHPYFSYFVLYDQDFFICPLQGDFVLKVEPPQGWSFGKHLLLMRCLSSLFPQLLHNQYCIKVFLGAFHWRQ